MIKTEKPHKQITIDEDVHRGLKQYCALKGKKLGHLTTNLLRDFLKTEHNVIECNGNGHMIIKGEREKPETIVAVMEDEEKKARKLRTLNDIQIVKRGNTYIVKNKRA